MNASIERLHHIEREVTLAGKEVLSIRCDALGYSVLEYDEKNVCTPYVVHAWLPGTGLFGGRYFERKEDAVAEFNRH